MMARMKRAHDETPWWARASVLAVGFALLMLAALVVRFTNEVKGYAEQNRASSL